MGAHTREPLYRFMRHVRKTESCWLWTGATFTEGYGQFMYSEGKNVTAHKFAYENLKEKVPDNMVLHHTCENKLCVNPEHMIKTTRKHHQIVHRSRFAKHMESLDYLTKGETKCQE